MSGHTPGPWSADKWAPGWTVSAPDNSPAAGRRREGEMNGHTPGPWKVFDNVGKKGELGVLADTAPCVIAHGMSEKHWPEIARANAALIAAAPDMLVALQVAADVLEAYNDGPGGDSPSVNCAYESVMSAIAKAEGR